MTVARFCAEHPYGLFIFRVAKHMLANLGWRDIRHRGREDKPQCLLHAGVFVVIKSA